MDKRGRAVAHEKTLSDGDDGQSPPQKPALPEDIAF
jgi:hypothetical protein